MKRNYTILSILFFCLLLIYAYFHTWEYDEAWTYLSVKHESFFDLLTYAHFNIANNHLINSFWFKLMQMGGASNVIFYRAASLASFWIYSYFLYKAVTYKADLWQPLSDWWLLLFFLPPIMIYFAIGRGYGLATALFIGSLYYMKVWLEEQRQADYWKCFFLGALSCLSIVSFLFPFAAMLIYMLFLSGDKLFSRKNIISAFLLLPLVLYIYYVGKTIILHDKIINGTDHLVVNGMYSTFVGALGIYDFVFPSPDLLARINLVTISRILIWASFLPVLWIMLRKRRARYPELTLLLIMTGLFVVLHLVLKAKYPSDRSVIYILYLLYIPIVLYIVGYKDKFFKLHYFTVLLFSLINFFSFFYDLTRPELYSVLKEKPVKQYTIVSDWPNWGDDVYNELYFGGRLHIRYVAKSFETDWPAADLRIKTAMQNPGTDYLLLQRSTWLRDHQWFDTLYPVQKVYSSAAKELYLIQIKKPAQ